VAWGFAGVIQVFGVKRKRRMRIPGREYPDRTASRPVLGHPAAGMDPLLRSEAWFVRRILKRDAGRALPVMR